MPLVHLDRVGSTWTRIVFRWTTVAAPGHGLGITDLYPCHTDSAVYKTITTLTAQKLNQTFNATTFFDNTVTLYSRYYTLLNQDNSEVC